MKFAVFLYLCLGGVLSGRHRGNRCNRLIANLERNRDRVVKRCLFDIDCGPPTDLENAVVNYTCTYFDSVATYRCNEGFSFIGYSGDVVCGVFQRWSDILGTCVVDCDIPPDVEGATVCYQATTVGAVATYSCVDSDEEIVGPDAATCDATGMWTPVVTSCSPVVDCGTPPDVEGAQFSNDATTVGAVATYSCVDGDEIIVGPDAATCDATGMWTPVVTPCALPADCPEIPLVSCAEVVVETTSLSEAMATYTCSVPGYEIVGPNQAVCNRTGTWTPVVAPCACPQLTEQFQKFPSKLITGFNTEVVRGVTVEECKGRCIGAVGFLCKSIDYKESESLCILSEYERCEVDSFNDSGSFDYYERIC